MSQSNEPWGPCPQGELSRMLHVQARMRQQRLLRRATPLVALLIVIAVSVIVVAQRNQPTLLGPQSHSLTCREALPLMTAMHRGELQRDQIRQVTHHLDNCPGCRERYQKMQADQQSSSPPSE